MGSQQNALALYFIPPLMLKKRAWTAPQVKIFPLCKYAASGSGVYENDEGGGITS